MVKERKTEQTIQIVNDDQITRNLQRMKIVNKTLTKDRMAYDKISTESRPTVKDRKTEQAIQIVNDGQITRDLQRMKIVSKNITKDKMVYDKNFDSIKAHGQRPQN